MTSLEDAGVVPRLVGDRPEEWQLGALTVVIDRGSARLRYAREPVGRAQATGGAIASAWRRAIARLGERSRAPERLLAELGAAYAAVVSRTGARAGDHVALVAVRAELGYPRAQFAWDLARLRRERRLVIDGRRVELGIATGHATARRSRVVWLEDDGGGAYYETFRLAQEANA
jgi:hypothetical protein